MGGFMRCTWINCTRPARGYRTLKSLDLMNQYPYLYCRRTKLCLQFLCPYLWCHHRPLLRNRHLPRHQHPDTWCWAHTHNTQGIEESAWEGKQNRIWDCSKCESIAKGQCGCYSIWENQQENIASYREYVVLGRVRIAPAGLRVVHPNEG